MHVDHMSPSGKKHILGGWLTMYDGAETEGFKHVHQLPGIGRAVGDEEIHVRGEARVAVKGHGMTADDQIINAAGV